MAVTEGEIENQGREIDALTESFRSATGSEKAINIMAFC